MKKNVTKIMSYPHIVYSGSLSDVFEFDLEDMTRSKTKTIKKMVDDIQCTEKSTATAR